LKLGYGLLRSKEGSAGGAGGVGAGGGGVGSGVTTAGVVAESA